MGLFFKRNVSTILTCVGGVGVVVTSIIAVKTTPKALMLLKKAEDKKGESLTKWEVIGTVAPVYVPSILIGTSTVACIFGASILNKQQQAALVSAYALIDSSYKEYKNKLVELCGEEVHQNIVDSIAVEQTNKVHIQSECLFSNCDLSLEDSYGEPILFYDEYAKRYFEASVEQVILAEYHLNRNFTMRGYAELNEFYFFLGLEPTEYGSKIGWTINDDCIFWIDFNHRKTVMDDGLECCIIEMPYGPTVDYMDDL